MTDVRVEELLAQLTLEEKASLTMGDDTWHLPPLARFGIGRLKMSDGPSGVRGERIGVKRSLSFPCGMAAGATWDVDLLGRYGVALAAEARSKGVHLLLGPTVGIPRTPLGGRTFESFAEDPWLASRLTVAYVNGVQANGVGCCVKHFACNDQEHERMSISVDVDERALREVHLAPFEAAVAEAGVWSVMSAYNRIDGTFCCEHPRLLGEILKREWGFDGVVVSDWFGTHSTVEAATAGLDVEMPGPGQWLGARLADAVKAGDVDGAVLDEQARRILRLAARTGVLDSDPAGVPEAEDDDPQRRVLARELALAGSVLLSNDGLLPLDTTRIRRLAVIGPSAISLASGGGGSSRVAPHRRYSLVDELRSRLDGIEVTYEVGCRLDRGAGRLDPALIPGGLSLEYFRGTEWEGDPAASERVYIGSWIAMADPVPGVSVAVCSVRATTTLVPDATGLWTLGIAGIGRSRVTIDGELVLDNMEPARGEFFYGLGSETVTAEIDLVAGEERSVLVEFASGMHGALAGFELFASRPQDPDAMQRAIAAAREADATIVVVGSNDQWETEGADRPDLLLVGDQDKLVREILAVNPRTAVVLNAGGPIETAWSNETAALMMVWYPGEEGEPALADILSGAAEPGGRLPITFPARLEDNPTHGDSYPGRDGVVRYGEGLLVGYRHYDEAGIEPAFAFGHGLGFTTFALGAVTADADGDEMVVTVPIANTGGRRGSQVVQLYVSDVDSSLPRPVKELKGFAKVTLDPDETTLVTLRLGDRAFSFWDEVAGQWRAEPGEFDLHIGTSSVAIDRTIRITR